MRKLWIAAVAAVVVVFSAVGRKGKTRTVRVTFVSEDGNKSTATTTYPK